MVDQYLWLFPCTLAGALGLLAAIANLQASSAQRNRAVTEAGAFGLCLGAVIYVLLLCLQPAAGGS
jgi:hypothetical protein